MGQTLPVLFLAALTLTPAWTVVPTDTKAVFRGISAPGGRVCWASGSLGTFARTVDGKTWTTSRVKGAEDAQFRSIVAFDKDSAVMLAIGEGDASRVVRTDDGGRTWVETWRNPEPKAFYDALAFWNRSRGLAFGDPVDGKIPILLTGDGGRSWTRAPSAGMPAALKDEAAFAASGRCLVVSGEKDAWICTGGGAARVFRSRDGGFTWSVAPTPMIPVTASAGLFGLLVLGPRDALAVGGDYAKPSAPGVAFRSRDGGSTWSPLAPPPGLREVALKVKGGFLLIGPSGTDLLANDGTILSTTTNLGALHTAASTNGTVWAVGDHGLIARWSA